IKTDHQSLKHLLQQRLVTTSQHKWLTKLLGMDFEIRYKSGRTNVAADALSRCTQLGLNSIITTVTTPELVEELKKSWFMTEEYAKILAQLQSGAECKNFTFDQGILRRKGRCMVGTSVNLRRKLLSMYHDGVLGGHSGAQATYKK